MMTMVTTCDYLPIGYVDNVDIDIYFVWIKF